MFSVGRRPFLRTFALNIGGNTHSYIFQVFMASYLVETVALGREFSAVLGGGIAPFISALLVQLIAGWIGVVIYMMAIMLVTLITAIRMPATRGRDLRLQADA